MNERNHDEGRATRRVPARNWARIGSVCAWIRAGIAGALWGTPLSAHAGELLPIGKAAASAGGTSGVPVDMDIQGDRLAVALGTGGWRLLDIQDPSRPTLVALSLYSGENHRHLSYRASIRSI